MNDDSASQRLIQNIKAVSDITKMVPFSNIFWKVTQMFQRHLRSIYFLEDKLLSFFQN